MSAERQRREEQAAIAQTWTRFSEAWQRGDVEEAAAAFDPDGDHRQLTVSGRVLKGRDALAHAFSDAFAQRRGHCRRTLHYSLASVRMIGADVAIVDGTLEFAPHVEVDGRALPAGEEPFTAVMRREGEIWYIAACRAGALQAH